MGALHACESLSGLGGEGTEIPSRRHTQHGSSRAACLALCLGSGQRPSWAWRQPGRFLQLANVRPHGGVWDALAVVFASPDLQQPFLWVVQRRAAAPSMR